ncbi:MAG TPA: hypothetical protein DDY13_07660 [Cytophagales bacterium]|jgi:hypothetical protein|nr:hypothetical protein [Cytophagales bacterium]
MLKRLIFILIVTIPAIAHGQIGVDFHYSNLPFFGVHYEIAERFRPEIRFGTDTFLEDISFEGVVTYDILNKADYELYAGLGGRTNDFSGLVIPIGMNFYPFEEKQFGFHFEVAPILGESDILRGSLGLRYRFQRE